MRPTWIGLASITLVLMVAAAAPVATQGTDFSGTWQLDRDASEFPQFGGGGGRGRSPGRMMGGATLVITQTADLLTIEQQSERGSRTLRYHLDGRESTNEVPRGELTTRSAWDGAALVTQGSQQLSTPRSDMSVDLVERRSLSADGHTMTVESTRATPRGDIAMRLVYTKSTT